MARTKLSPSDSLWLAILERNTELQSRAPEEVRAELKAGGFPERVIEAYLAHQQVVVIPLPQRLKAGAKAPSADLLEEDAAEFVRRPETLGPINRGELE